MVYGEDVIYFEVWSRSISWIYENIEKEIFRKGNNMNKRVNLKCWK